MIGHTGRTPKIQRIGPASTSEDTSASGNPISTSSRNVDIDVLSSHDFRKPDSYAHVHPSTSPAPTAIDRTTRNNSRRPVLPVLPAVLCSVTPSTVTSAHHGGQGVTGGRDHSERSRRAERQLGEQVHPQQVAEQAQ